MRRVEGNQSRGAQILNISRGSLIAKLKEFGDAGLPVPAPGARAAERLTPFELGPSRFDRTGSISAPPSQQPPQRERRGEAAGDLVEVEASRPEVARDASRSAPRSRRPAAWRTPTRPGRRARGRGWPRDRAAASQKRRKRAGSQGTGDEREERHEQDEVEVQVRRRKPRPRRGRRKVGSVDADLAALRRERVTAGLSKVADQEARRGRRSSSRRAPRRRTRRRARPRTRRPCAPRRGRRAGAGSPPAAQRPSDGPCAPTAAAACVRCSRDAQKRNRSTLEEHDADCHRTVWEEEKRAGRCAPIQKSETTRTRLSSWIAAKPSDEPEDAPPPGRGEGEDGRAEEQRRLDAVAAVLDLDRERAGADLGARDRDLFADRPTGAPPKRAPRRP